MDDRVLSLWYVSLVLLMGIFSSLFMLMDFLTTVIGGSDRPEYEVNPETRALLEDGNISTFYHRTWSRVEFNLSVMLFSLSAYVLSFFVRGLSRDLLEMLSFVGTVYLIASAVFHVLPVYNNLWTLYYLSRGG